MLDGDAVIRRPRSATCATSRSSVSKRSWGCRRAPPSARGALSPSARSCRASRATSDRSACARSPRRSAEGCPDRAPARRGASKLADRLGESGSVRMNLSSICTSVVACPIHKTARRASGRSGCVIRASRGEDASPTGCARPSCWRQQEVARGRQGEEDSCGAHQKYLNRKVAIVASGGGRGGVRELEPEDAVERVDPRFERGARDDPGRLVARADGRAQVLAVLQERKVRAHAGAEEPVLGEAALDVDELGREVELHRAALAHERLGDEARHGESCGSLPHE